MASFNESQLQERISRTWDESIVPSLVEYIKIPNKSPSFEPAWQELGHMEQALQLALEWSKSKIPEKAQIQVKRSAGRTPLLLIDIPGERNGNVLMYGHLDKQPDMEGWDDDLGPWKPVLKDNKLYGRGGADDGYALFPEGVADDLYAQSVGLIRREGKASTSFIQRHLQIGYNRAARIMDQMEADGLVSPANHVGKREVLISESDKVPS